MKTKEEIEVILQISYTEINSVGGWDNATCEARDTHEAKLCGKVKGIIVSEHWTTHTVYSTQGRDEFINRCMKIGILIAEHRQDPDAKILASEIHRIMSEKGVFV